MTRRQYAGGLSAIGVRISGKAKRAPPFFLASRRTAHSAGLRKWRDRRGLRHWRRPHLNRRPYPQKRRFPPRKRGFPARVVLPVALAFPITPVLRRLFNRRRSAVQACQRRLGWLSARFGYHGTIALSRAQITAGMCRNCLCHCNRSHRNRHPRYSRCRCNPCTSCSRQRGRLVQTLHRHRRGAAGDDPHRRPRRSRTLARPRGRWR